MHRKPRRKRARALVPYRSNWIGRANITIANYHGYRVTRSRAPFPAAVRLYNSSNIHFRNVHVNAESGYAVCDENGCGTFLRASKYPYSNAIEDMTRHLEVREREFAVLDLERRPSTSPAAVAPASDWGQGCRYKNWLAGFFLSQARPWTIPVSCISSIIRSSASMVGRKGRTHD